MVLSLSILGIFLSVILLYFNATKYTSSIYLGIFFLGVSMYGLFQYTLFNSKSVYFVTIFLFVIPVLGSLSYLIGPMLFWYVRSVLTDKTHLKKSDIWHFVPSIIFIIAALPKLFLPWSLKVEAATAIVNNAASIQFYKPTVLSDIFSFAVMFLSRPILILGYTIWSTGLFLRYLLSRQESLVLSRQYFMKNWLMFLLGSLLILVISHILLVIDLTEEGSFGFFTLRTFQVLASAGLIGLLISPFFFPTILYGLPRFPELISTSKAEEIISLPEVELVIPGSFENDYLLIIHLKAESCMKKLQPYLQADCNLAYFSKLVKTPVHHLAYYFREVKKQAFNDYRNEWRINHAKNLITEGKANELTLEAIGLLSGFSTRNTFFTAFKKAEGISPGIFAAQFAK